MKRAEPIFDAIASKVYRLGAEAGAGSAFKMINQLLAGIHIAAACEAIAFAKKLGLDLSKVYEVITASAGNSWMFENRVPHILDNDYAPKSAVNIFTKDLGIVSDMARAASFPTPLAASALQMFLMTAASEWDATTTRRSFASTQRSPASSSTPARTPAISRRARQSAPLNDDHV